MSAGPDEFNESLFQRMEDRIAAEILKKHSKLIDRVKNIHGQVLDLPKEIESLVNELKENGMPDYGLKDLLKFFGKQRSNFKPRNIYTNVEFGDWYKRIGEKIGIDSQIVKEIYSSRIQNLNLHSYRKPFRSVLPLVIIETSYGKDSVTAKSLSEDIKQNHNREYEISTIQIALRALTSINILTKLGQSSYHFNKTIFTKEEIEQKLV